MDEMSKEDFDAFANDEVPEGDEPKLGLTPEGMAQTEQEYADAFNEPEPDVKAKAQDDFDDAMADAGGMEAEKEVAAQVAKPVETPKPTSFKDTFAAARKDGLKVFDWNGKKYTTALKGEAKPAQKAVAKAAAVVDKSVPPPATFSKEPPAKQGAVPKLTMLPKEGTPSIYEKRKPVQQAGSGFENQIPV